MIPSGFTVEIEDAAEAWQDVTTSVASLSDGTGSEGDIIPSVDVTFIADLDASIAPLLNPQTNRSRPRIRITEGSRVVYFLMEGQTGSVQRNYQSARITGRAYAGRLVDLHPLSYTWDDDTNASVIAAQAAHANVAAQSGETIGVAWLSATDPVIPGGRYQVAKKGRLEIVKELAAACGAFVRVSSDGLGIEVYDRLARSLPGVPSRSYPNALSLSYQMDRCNSPSNAVRVLGVVLNYTRPTLPLIGVTVVPPSIAADGVKTATAACTVHDSSGNPVVHKNMVDQAIAAGSYDTIPVSGCYEVQGVWLNTGTQDAPVKGTRITVSSYTASAISVPPQSTQLFIVSYTQATAVSWSVADYQDQVTGEAQTTSNNAGGQPLIVATDDPIGRVRGVYRATDTNRTGTNYFNGGSATVNTQQLTLGISPGPAGTAVLVDYDKYVSMPLGVAIDPTTSLCDPSGNAQTTVAAGTVVGTAVITASALGVSGDGQLTLTGAAVGGMTVTVNPAILKAITGYLGGINQITNESTKTATGSLNNRQLSYVAVAHPIHSVSSVIIGITKCRVYSWANNAVAGDYRIYLADAYPDNSAAIANYATILQQASDAAAATVTASVVQHNGTAVADGTKVSFVIFGNGNGASLSSAQATTAAGKAEIQLYAGRVAQFTLRTTCGPYHYDALIKVMTNPPAIDPITGNAITGSSTVIPPTQNAIDCPGSLCPDGSCGQSVQQDSNDADGSVSGQRRLVDCDGNGIPYVPITMGKNITYTDEDGYFWFYAASTGSNAASAYYNGKDWPISIDVAPQNSSSRGSTYYLNCSGGA